MAYLSTLSDLEPLLVLAKLIEEVKTGNNQPNRIYIN